MKQIAITAMLILAVTASAALTLHTGSLRSAGAFGLVAVVGWAWWAWVDVWPMAKSVWREIVRQKETW